MEIEKKIERAVAFLRNIPNDKPVEVAYSGGKDSDVILELVKMAGLKYVAIYKNTTIDPPGTIAYVKSRGATIVQPKRSFYDIIKAKGMPSRRKRFCCSELKEGKRGYDRVILGVRRDESMRRRKMYKEPERCDERNKGVKLYYPILDWSANDVKKFIQLRQLRINPLYYNDNGELDVTKRLGCIGCPLASEKQRREQYKKYPGILRACVNALKEYSHDAEKAYSVFVLTLFFKNRNSHEEFNNIIFSELQITNKEILEQYFKIKL